jgi:RNA polymerase sigma-54 factor
MEISMKQSLQQEQKLLLTHEMKISLQLLQMPIMELQECIEKELDENPFLEVDYDKMEMPEEIECKNMKKEDEAYDYEKLIQHNNNDDDRVEILVINSDDDYDNNPLNYLSRTLSLKDYLREQLVDRKENTELYIICNYLIELINEDGFLTDDIHEIASELSKPDELVHNAAAIVKDLQPYGIGAKDFRESLIIQLKKINCFDVKLEAIIMKHMELLADNKLRDLSKILGVKLGTIQQYVNVIKSLEPKPARGFYTGDEIGYIIPEAFLKKIGNDYYIIMNDDMLPKLNVNSYYQRIMKESRSQEAVNFMKDKVNNALALIKGIEQRRRTIYRILEIVIEYQKDYFDRGEAYLKPMNLNDLAIQLNMHESTISRAVKDKYISVPNGTIRLKNLFTNGINTNFGEEDISTNVIKNEIARLIKTENKKIPLSDQTICEILKNEKMNISRRTVAKYREEMDIRSSSKRKSF